MSSSDSLEELGALVKSAGATVVGYVCQKRKAINAALYVGKGKAQEIAERAEQYDADVVIFDNDLSPGQIRELEKIISCKVLDRSELILDIFATRARTAEAKMQVDLAQLQYTYPRLTRMWSHLDTVVGGAGSGTVGAVGGIGTRGTGEKQLEIDRRLIKKRLSELHHQIAQIDKRKERQVQSRSGQYLTISLVGYTNAGKSTLMNLLTGSEVYVADKLFATLDTKTKRWNVGQELFVLLSDTVGFVRDLPHHLVASFRATLEEAIHADLLLHVVDVSHPNAQQQIQAVNTVLGEIGCAKKDVLLILNKVDRPGCTSRRDLLGTLYPEAVAVSARTGEGVDRLVEMVHSRAAGEKLHLRISCDQSDGKVHNFLRAYGQIIAENYLDSQMILEAYLGRRQLTALERLKPITCEILSARQV